MSHCSPVTATLWGQRLRCLWDPEHKALPRAPSLFEMTPNRTCMGSDFLLTTTELEHGRKVTSLDIHHLSTGTLFIASFAFSDLCFLLHRALSNVPRTELLRAKKLT